MNPANNDSAKKDPAMRKHYISQLKKLGLSGDQARRMVRLFYDGKPTKKERDVWISKKVLNKKGELLLNADWEENPTLEILLLNMVFEGLLERVDIS